MDAIYEKVWSEIRENDIVAIQAMMNDFNVFKGDVEPCISKASKGVMTAILTYASAASLSGSLDEAMASELIDRLAMKVDIIQLSSYVVACAAIEAKDTDAIPEEIRMALGGKENNDDLIQAIGDLDPAIFATLLRFIAEGGIEQMYAANFLPIIRRIYEDKIIDRGVLFAYMALSLRKTFEESMAEKSPSFALLSAGLSSLSPF
jgi:hypothetical protein